MRGEPAIGVGRPRSSGTTDRKEHAMNRQAVQQTAGRARPHVVSADLLFACRKPRRRQKAQRRACVW